jgi:hypothetical protein
MKIFLAKYEHSHGTDEGESVWCGNYAKGHFEVVNGEETK